MLIITPVSAARDAVDDADEGLDSEIKPLSVEEAEKWRENNPPVSPWRIVVMQVLVGVFVVLVAGALTSQAGMIWSAGYGALAVIVPAALFARGLSRQKTVANAGAAMVGFFVWEMVKIALTVAMLVAAPRLISQLSWLALLAGFVVTMKVYWVAVWLRPIRKSQSKD